MKILYIIHSCMMGGATISFYNLLKEIKKNNNDIVVVYLIERDTQIIDKLNELGCKCIGVRYIPCTWIMLDNFKKIIKFPLTIVKLIIKKIYFYNKLNKIVFSEKPDIIHTNTGVVHEGYSVAKKRNISHVWHLREYQLKDFNYYPLPCMKFYKKTLKKSFSISITKDINKYFELDKCLKASVVYNPIMSINYLPNKDENLSTSPYFMVSNRLSKEKGVEDTILAFSNFYKNHKDYKLYICGFGDNSYIEYLKNLCKEKGIQNSVIFLGYLESNQIYNLMYNSKALIVSSYNEGFGRMTAEANMLGIPVIGRNTAGTKEILDLTNGGLRFTNIVEMTDCMEKISSMNKDEIITFMEKPRTIAREHFSCEKHASKVVSIYNDILRGGVYRCRVKFDRINPTYNMRVA